METKLYYNGQLILSGQPTPLVARADSMVRYGERWAEQVTINLRGQITGCPLDFSGLVLAQQDLVSVFNKDYQSFQIVEDDQTIFSTLYTVVKSVSFPSSTYVGILDYDITLECYPEDLFSGVFGVLDPTNTWDFEESQDGKFTATHTISARGFNTSSGNSNAFKNAQNFVQARTGLVDYTDPYFITLPSGFVPCLKETKATANRFNGTYSITEVYHGDLYTNSGGVVRYSTDFNCAAMEGFARVKIAGQIEGCTDQSIADLRAKYNSFDPYGKALETYVYCTNRSDLNPNYLFSGVVEDSLKPVLNFDIEFDNFTGASVYFDYQAIVSSGDNDIVKVDVDGLIGGRGDLAARWTRVNNYYNSLDLFAIAQDAYSDFGANGVLHPESLASGVTFNSFMGEIRTSASFDDRTIPVNGFSDFTYSMNFVPSLQKVTARPLLTNAAGPVCSDSYYVVDLGYKNRCSFTVEGNGTIACDSNMATCVANLKNFANDLYSEHSPNIRGNLENYTISTGVNTLSFVFGWSSETAPANNVVSPKVNYDSVNNLSIT